MFFPGINGGDFLTWLMLITVGLIVYLTSKNKEVNKHEQDIQPPAPGTGRNALARPVVGQKRQEQTTVRYSALSIFMAVVLFGVLVMFGERLLFDLNRYINPVIDKEYTQQKNQQRTSIYGDVATDGSQGLMHRSEKMTRDSVSAISQTKIYYPALEKGRYLMYKLIIHSAVVIPLFVLAFALFYYKRKNIKLRALLISFLCFSFWMIFHLLGEAMAFVMDEYRNIAIYIILIMLGVVFASVTYFSQVKLQKDEDNA